MNDFVQKKSNPPSVSLIIPCRNEEKYIGNCFESLIAKQDYPKESLEILVVDGMSEDKTREIVKNYAEKYPFIRLLENHKKFTPFALNIGIRKAEGEIIVRADAHTEYPKNYIKTLVYYMTEGYKGEKIDNVGGAVATPSLMDIAAVIDKDKIKTKAQIIAHSIALCLSNSFGAASSFRLGVKEPQFVDTVFGGCYRKEFFERLKLADGEFFNEKLIRSQDLEFNLRLKEAGGKILLVPDIVFKYYPKPNFWEFFKHNFTDGVWVIYPLKFGIKAFSFRHLLPLGFVSILSYLFIFSFFSKIYLFFFAFALVAYISAGIFFSCSDERREGDWRYCLFMPLAFACRHFGYGMGSFWGLFKLIF